tara:strand:+ start:136 stop:432 length:297 start_codon:yes stop_codon:yes gene_type:complete
MAAGPGARVVVVVVVVVVLVVEVVDDVVVLINGVVERIGAVLVATTTVAAGTASSADPQAPATIARTPTTNGTRIRQVHHTVVPDAPRPRPDHRADPA